MATCSRACVCPQAEASSFQPSPTLAVAQSLPANGLPRSEVLSGSPASELFGHLWVLLGLLNHSRKMLPGQHRQACARVGTDGGCLIPAFHNNKNSWMVAGRCLLGAVLQFNHREVPSECV